ncbi:SpoIIE family protein phosphatase [Flammeovirga sp. SubArs3]|uniref:SpoIIE family protein phosphatase n=1 Tax=Flammeovirga sp. SubArs3 TaxID=2995316 RepID=UPI00248C55A6|nr:SpoIIE family protein phosphatase [Flammeovirga sp. SubArs3]
MFLQKLIYTTLLLLFTFVVIAQENKNFERLAKKAYEEHHYSEALSYMEPLVKMDPTNESYIYSLAVCYIKTNQSGKGVDLLKSIKKSASAQTSDYYYYLAEGYLYLTKLTLAEDALYQASLYPNGIEDINYLKNRIKHAKKILKSGTNVIVRHLGGIVNTPANEHSITLTKDHQSFLFTRVAELPDKKTDVDYLEKIYKAYMDENDDWATPISVQELSSDGHDATVQLYDEDTKAILYRDGNLYTRTLSNGEWGPEVPLKGVNTVAQETHAYISKDHQTLIYASRGHGHHEDLDLYQTTWNPKKKQWKEPIPLKELNTPYDEDSPFLSDDGELFFSSQGHNSMGGYDIFRSVYDSIKREWTTPQNLGHPINSTSDDIYFSMYGKLGYFSSARTNSVGQLDIYQVFFFNKVRINGLVLQNDGTPFINANVRLQSESNIYETITDEKGKYSLLADLDNNFIITVEKNSNIFHEGTYAIKIGVRNNKNEENHFYVLKEKDIEDGIVDAQAPTTISVTVHNSFDFNPQLGLKQGVDMTVNKPINENKIIGNVTRNGFPVEGVNVTVNNKTYISDKNGKFSYNIKRELGIFKYPRHVSIAKEDMELESWYLEDGILHITIREKLQDVLEGIVYNEDGQPIPNKSIHILVHNKLFSTNTKSDGSFTITFPIGVRLKRNFEVTVPGRTLKSFAQERRELSQYIEMKVSNQQTISNVGFRVQDQNGNLIPNALILVDGKFTSTNDRGYTSMKVGMTFNEFEASKSLVLIHSYEVLRRSFDPLQRTLTMTVKVEEEPVENIEVSAAADPSSIKSIEQRREELSIRNDFLSVYEKTENKELIAQYEIDSLRSELTRLEDKLTQVKDSVFTAQDSSMLSMINVLRNKLEQKEQRMSQFKENNQLAHEKYQKEALMYGVSIFGLFLLIVGLMMIIRRTYLQKQKVELVKEELDNAMTQVNDQNVKITNSLRAAQTIQYAILPPMDLLESKFKKFFTLYRPKDIVSGDFYWFGEVKDIHQETHQFFACVDCTGHGVPGALMSMIGKTILQEVLDKRLSQDPAIILEMLNQRIIAYLRQQENSINDGMDIALCKLYTNKEGNPEILFAGAKSDIYIIRRKYGVLERHRGSKKSIGGKQRVGREFECNKIVLEEGDAMLMLTDGILDQNNEKNDKFGRRYFEKFVRQHIDQPIEDLGDLIEAALDVHQKTIPQRDDITVIGIEF